MKSLHGRFIGPVIAVVLVLLPVQTAFGFSQGRPKSLGFDAERLTRIDRFMQEAIDNGEIPGALSVVMREGRIVHWDTRGFQDKDANKPLTDDTIFRIFSMTKPVTAVAALILVEEGRLALYDPVSRYIPAFADMTVYVSGEGEGLETEPLTAPMTVHHLFTHMSGLTYPNSGRTGAHKAYETVGITRPGDAESLQAFAENVANVPLLFQPGTRWEYGLSNDVLAYVVEAAAGQPFAAFAKERIFDPLDMPDTAFHVPEDKINRFAVSYERTEDGLAAFDRPETSAMGNPNRPPSGGGGLVSTANDYLRFAQMLLNGGELDGVRVLSPSSVRLMSRSHLPAGQSIGPGNGYGLAIGVNVNTARAGKFGNDGAIEWSGAESTHFWIDPDAQIVGLFMTQLRPFDRSYGAMLRTLTYQAFVE